MSFLATLYSFAQKEGKQVSNFARGLVIQAAASPATSDMSGDQKHDTVVDALKQTFGALLARFGDLAHDAASMLVHDAYATVLASTPEILQPLVASTETAVQQSVFTVVDDGLAATAKQGAAALATIAKRATTAAAVPKSTAPLAAATPPASLGIPGITAPSVQRPVAPVGESQPPADSAGA